MYYLTVKTQFAAAHRLINYDGDCENLHGHNWKVEACVSTRTLDSAGLGIDFKVLKKKTNEVLDTFDHKYVNDIPPFNEISPSSENMASFIFERLKERLNNENVQVFEVKVWESDNACACYRED